LAAAALTAALIDALVGRDAISKAPSCTVTIFLPTRQPDAVPIRSAPSSDGCWLPNLPQPDADPMRSAPSSEGCAKIT
jgi:hypothetical protein